MEATKQNVQKVRNQLAFDLTLMKNKYYNKLTPSQMKELDIEIDRKIERLLPSYSGETSPSTVFRDILKRTIDNFAKSL